MFNWNSLVDETAIFAVLSDGYARFARPVREGLVKFLEGLPDAFQEKILAQQTLLSPSASISQRLALLARSCPVLHKLGQILARDQRLAPELRAQLRELESFSPTVPEEAIRKTLARELGPLELRGIRLVLPAIAEASVAVVVPYVDDGTGFARETTDGKPQNGVFKILKPGIEERLELELDLLTKVGSHLDERCDALAIPHLDYEDSFQQICEKLRSEVCLTEEQNHLALAAKFYADEPQVHIPALMVHCTSRVTAMERIVGVKITDHSLECRHARRRLADLVVRALMAHPFFSRPKEAMFHCDPHAGNLFWTHDDRLAILDWSLVSWLNEAELLALVQILQAATAMNTQGIVDVLLQLSDRRSANRTALATIVKSNLEKIRHGQVPGCGWFVGLLDEAVQSAGLRLAAELMLLRKSLHSLEGVLADMGADVWQLDRTVFTQFLVHFAAEFPGRWLVSPFSHDFNTHLSNTDLTQMAINYPSTVARFWLGNSFDVLETYRRTDKLLGESLFRQDDN